MPTVIVFQSARTGDHILDVMDIDTNGNTNTASAVIPIRAGYNYAINVKIGGAIYIYIDGTNVSSVSSSSSSSSSSSFSSSSLSSSSVSSVSSTSASSSLSSVSSVSSSSSIVSSSSISSISSLSSASSVSSASSSVSSSSSIISGIQVVDITSYTARIVWTTIVPSTSQVLYGLDDWLPFQTPLDTNLVTNHSVFLDNLIPWGRYYYKVKSMDNGGYVYISELRTFETPIDLTPPTVYNVSVVNITSNSAMVSWQTDELSDSEIQYWCWEGSTKITRTRSNNQNTLTHQFALSGLPAQKLITYNVSSKDRVGFKTTSPNYTFTTLAP